MSTLYVVLPNHRVPWVERLLCSIRARCMVSEFSGACGTADTWYVLVGEEVAGVAALGEALRGGETVDVRLAERGREGVRQLRYGRFRYASRYGRTLDRIADQCAEWIAQELRSRGAGSPVILWLRGARAHWRARPAERVLLYGRDLARFFRGACRRAFQESRSDVAVAHASLEALLARGRHAGLRWIARDEREDLGDPFLASSSGRTRLVCHGRRGGRSGLVAIDLGTDERHSLATGAGRYPNAFEVEGEQWLAPDGDRERRMRAYRLNGRATLVASWSLDGIAPLGATMVEHASLWWLFCTDRYNGPDDALHVYWSYHPRGPWHAHLRNPVKVDASGARPAGNFFFRDGTLYRPARDYTDRFGNAIVLQRIDVLTPERFAETCVARIDASVTGRTDAADVGTLSQGYGWLAIDARFTRWSAVKPLRVLLRRLR